MKKEIFHHPFGPCIEQDGTQTFRVWAPYAREVELNISSPKEMTIPMTHKGDGVYVTNVDIDAYPIDYTYILDGEKERPDPASFSQPFGIGCPSRLCDPHQSSWTDQNWQGLNLRDMIIYELHVGTFTPEGTFQGVIDKIPYFKKLGINTIELMPVATFSGKRNWGYDGVQLYAPQESYGGPEGLKNLINACHENDIAVILDVVYNHLGPEGNYLEDFGPYFTSKYTTPWGKAINYDGEYSTFVREFVIENAIYWLKHYHIDGLRLDAIHGIFDQSAYHILEEMRDRFKEAAKQEGRQAWLIAESDLNDPIHVSEQIKGGYGLDAQWNDDFHHAVHAYLTGTRQGYFQDFGTLENISKALTYGFVYDGIWSGYRKRIHGKSSVGIPGLRMVNFIQNHDQIANASRGERLAGLLDKKRYLLASTLLLLSPSLPLLFMGQEWGAKTPFYFFTNFQDPNLQVAVREGRLQEYSANGISEGFRDPEELETFKASTLDWSWEGNDENVEIFCHYKKLIDLRKNHPALNNCKKTLTHVKYSEENQWMIIERSAIKGESCIIFINFSEYTTTIPTDEHVYQGKALYATENMGHRHKLINSITLEPYSLALYDCTLSPSTAKE